MHYQKITVGKTIIEFYNNWLGEESISVNGQAVSRKSSVWGTNHYFTVVEDGRNARYVLTTRINGMGQVVIDLTRNNRVVEKNIPTRHGTRPSRPSVPKVNKAKKEGLLQLRNYELTTALEKFEEAIKFDPEDGEIYFHLACIYSVQEKTQKGFDAISKSVELGLTNEDAIMTHDMLAFLRIHPAFDDFLDSGFKSYDESLIEPEPEEWDMS